MSESPKLTPLSVGIFATRFTPRLQSCVENTIFRSNEALKAMEEAPSEEKQVYATVAAGYLNVLAQIMSK